MSINKLPVDCDPQRYAQENVQFSGLLPTAAMLRLQSLVDKTAESAQVALSFSFDDDGNIVIDGRLELTVTQACQRCLSTVEFNVVSEFLLAPVKDDAQAEQLPDEYGPVMTNDKRLDLYDMLEDEIILSLPLEAKHPDGDTDCHYQAYQADAGEANPFAELQQILSQSND